MTGWAILALMAMLLAGGLIAVARPARPAAMLMASALLVAFAGYAWQGRPGLAGRPTRPQDAGPPPAGLFARERRTMLETVGPDPQVLDAADRLIAAGDADYAIATVRAALNRRPRSMMLWLGLGHALTSYADGQVTPPARYAFDRAAALAPAHPAPLYFLGLAYAEAGDMRSAGTVWSEMLARRRAAPAPRPADAARLPRAMPSRRDPADR